jgi:sulfotransferase famil protein
MPVYPQKNAIFIHIPKTAGGAIEALLEAHTPGVKKTLVRRLLSKLPLRQPVSDAYIPGHATASWIKTKLGASYFDGCEKFTVVRNPYDRIISHYEFIRQTDRHHKNKAVQGMGFETFLKSRRPDQLSQAPFLTDCTGRMLVQHVARFETLHGDLDKIFSHLGFEERLPAAGAMNTSQKKPRDEYLTQEAISLINAKAAADFSLLGYQLL